MLRTLALLSLLPAAVGQQRPGTQPPPVVVREALDSADSRWHGAATIADGVTGAAARFDGDQARIDVGRCPITSREPFTLRCAIRTSRGSFCTPLMARDGNAVGLSLVMGRRPGHVSFEAWSWGSVRLLSTHRIDDGQWHRIEVTYDPATTGALLYIDEQLQSYGVLGAGGSPTANLRLGDNIGAHQPFQGDLDEVEVVATTKHVEVFARLRPVIPIAERKAALAALRATALPVQTESLTAEARDQWADRRLTVRRHVAETLGLTPPPGNVPFDVQVHGEIKTDGVLLQRVSWIGFPGQRATGWLWSPQPRPAGRLPTVLCPHGHWQNGALHPVVQARCAAFARFGWLALATDSVHVEDVASGVNSVGAMTWHNQRAIGWLLERDDVDPRRIAVTGASGGGQQSYYLMALEDRLVAAAPIVMACYWNEIISDTSAHCGCNHTPSLAAFTDVPEMCAVFAPRPAFFGTVTGDWTKRFQRKGLPELTAHWGRLDTAPPRSRHGDEGHNYDQPMREAVYGFLHDVMQGVGPAGDPRTRVAEPAGPLFSPERLEPLLGARPPARLDRRTMAREYLARRPRTDSLAHLAPGLDFDVQPAEIQWRDDGKQEWRRGSVAGPDGVPIPFRMRRQDPADTRTTTPYIVTVNPRGAAMALATGVHSVLVGPRPYGEWQPFRSAWQRNGLLLGRGEGYQAAVDIALVCASLPGDKPVHVVGLGEAGVAVLLAARLCDRIRKVTTHALGRSYATDGNRAPLCPGLLRFGDLPALIAGLPDGVRHEIAPARR